MNVEQASREVTLSDIFQEILQLRSEVSVLRERTGVQQASRTFFKTKEVAARLERDEYTVREWCRFGRINAVKRVERRGGSAAWNIAAEEIERVLNEGLLPHDPRRNDRN